MLNTLQRILKNILKLCKGTFISYYRLYHSKNMMKNLVKVNMQNEELIKLDALQVDAIYN